MRFLLICLLLAGCCSHCSKYSEGTMTQIGAYAPVNGQLVGLEVVNYLNGCRITAASNMLFKIERQYSATNDYFFGMVKTIETTNTKVNFK